ncbi:uncharacterized protein FTJAE_8097 [Fusarium tjaetaba]|uniref:Uncharacterized protein n=1 Tax=Fusarium tjaetaba TaxID=1567544 RepID=A0A8H5RCX7_9HYPO|nr:uncharacterized protein FTJAE_8097 [Fusarium tjaetaba]KAF5630758.1 hypothetical protein FTJAE_8097 [Fusarium tjaetaba]
MNIETAETCQRTRYNCKCLEFGMGCEDEGGALKVNEAQSQEKVQKLVQQWKGKGSIYVPGSKARGSLLPEFKKQHLELNDKLSEKARTQIDSFIKDPEAEDPDISKHYLVGKYGTRVINWYINMQQLDM